MEILYTHPKAAVLLAGAWILLGLQNTGAQTTHIYRNTTGPVPGWGIALLVMLSLLAATLLLGLIFLPLWCQKSENDCQDGIAFYSPNILCRPRQACDEQCEQGCPKPCEPCSPRSVPMPCTSPVIVCKPREPRIAECEERSCVSPNIVCRPREPRAAECEERSCVSIIAVPRPREFHSVGIERRSYLTASSLCKPRESRNDDCDEKSYYSSASSCPPRESCNISCEDSEEEN
ncbi:uncharacterized protein [Dendropsophus ebraccatus]|uniref:uncharacterized protein n=1 Tax=Dendropsophus ebraccatus TaxID=150705 RepID=UPI0038311BED